MKKIPLLPRYFRWIGLVLVLLSLVWFSPSLYRNSQFSTSENESQSKDNILEDNKVADTISYAIVPDQENHSLDSTNYDERMLDVPFYESMSMLAIYDGSNYFVIRKQDMSLTISLLFPLLGLSLIAFSKNKVEDEMIHSLRLFSWSWSIIVIILFSIFTTLFIYGMTYISFAFFYIHLMLIFYLIIFWINIWKMNRRLLNEE